MNEFVANRDWRRYLWSPLLLGIAVLGRVALHPHLGTKSPFALFMAASFTAAWIAGLGPGLLTALAGGVIATALFAANPHEFADWFGYATYLGLSGLGIGITASLRSARRQERAARLLAEARLGEVERERTRGDDAIAAADVARERLASFLGNITDGYLLFDRDLKIVDVNQTILRWSGFTREQLVGRHVREVLPTASALLEVYERALATGEPQRHLHQGTLVADWYDVDVHPGPEGLAVFVRDANERVRAENRRRVADERFRLAATAARAVLFQVDPETGEAEWHGLADVLGYPPAPGQNAEWFCSLAAEEDRERCLGDQGRDRYESEYRLKNALGEWRVLRETGARILGEDGRPLLVGMCLDVTEYREREAVLRASEERYRLAAEAISGFVYDWEPARGTVERTAGLATVVGVRAENAPPTSEWWRERIHPEDMARLDALGQAAVGTGSWSVNYRVRHEDGEYRWVWDRAVVVETPDGTRVVGQTVDITRQVETERALEESERLNRTLVDFMPAIVWTTDAEGLSTGFNRRWYEYTGLVPGGDPDREWREKIHPEDLPGVDAEWEIARRLGRDFAFEYRVRRADGAYRWHTARSRPLRDAEGGIVRWVGTAFDVHVERERARAERFLRDLERDLAPINDAAELTRLAVARIGSHVAANRSMFALADPEDPEVVSVHDSFVMNADPVTGRFRLPDFGRALVRQIRAGSTVVVRDLHRDPAFADVRDSYDALGVRAMILVPILREDRLLALLSLHSLAARDWTAQEVELTEEVARRLYDGVLRVRADAAARASEERYRFLAESVPGMVWTARPDGVLDYVNQAWLDYFRTDLSEAQARGWEGLIHPEDLPAVAEHWGRSVAEGVPLDLPYRIRRAADGQFRWHVARAVPLRVDGRVDRWIGTITDVHDLQEAQDALRSSEAKFRALAEASPNFVWMADAEGNMLFINRRFAEYAGDVRIVRASELVDVLTPREDAERLTEEFLRARDARREFSAELRIRSKEGELRWFETRVVPLFDESGEVSRWVGSTADVHDRKTEGERLARLVDEKTAALVASNRELESFCYSVSHDLRAPLRAVNTASMILIEDYGDQLTPSARHELERQAAAAKRMGLLIDDLLQLSRLGRTEIAREPLDLAAISRSVWRELRDPGRLDVPETLPADGDPKLARLLLQNLLENGVKYSKPGETPRLAVGRREDGAYFVRDEGRGFEPEYREKVFEPFHRLHPDGAIPGTGIGLANVKRIIERHDGRIWIETAPDEGTTVFFTLN